MADLIILGEIDLKTGQLVLSAFIAEMGRNGLPGQRFLARAAGDGRRWPLGHSPRCFASVPSVSRNLWEIWLPKGIRFLEFALTSRAWTTFAPWLEIANREQTSPWQFIPLRKSPHCSNPQTNPGGCPAKPRREAQKMQEC